MWERIQELRKFKGYSVKKIETDMGFSNGSLKKINEKTECGRLYALAQYFGVSMEYLMAGKQDLPSAPLPQAPFYSKDEQELLDGYRKLDDIGKGKLAAYLDGLLQGGNLVADSKKERRA